MEQKKRKRDGSVGSSRIAVRGLPKDISEEELRTHFSQYGTVVKIVILTRGANKKPRGVALLTFLDPGAVERVLAEEHTINNKKVTVELGEENELGGSPPLATEGDQPVQHPLDQIWTPAAVGAYNLLMGEAPHHLSVGSVKKIDKKDEIGINTLAASLRDTALLGKDPEGGDEPVARSWFWGKKDFNAAILGTIPHVLQSEEDFDTSNEAEITNSLVDLGEYLGIQRPSVYSADYGKPVYVDNPKRYFRAKKQEHDKANVQLQQFNDILRNTLP